MTVASLVTVAVAVVGAVAYIVAAGAIHQFLVSNLCDAEDGPSVMYGTLFWPVTVALIAFAWLCVRVLWPALRAPFLAGARAHDALAARRRRLPRMKTVSRG